MSYCRMGADSDVYMYPSAIAERYVIVCCSCALDKRRVYAHFTTPKAALAHLHRHIAAGHSVPASATERLRREVARATKGRVREATRSAPHG